MFVACSTLCFGKYPLDHCLRIINDLGFSKIDVAIHEGGPHLGPSEIAGDVNRCVQQIRIGSSLSPAAFSVEFDTASDDELHSQLRAVCRLARLTTVPVVSIPAEAADAGINNEVARLQPLVQLAEAEGVMLCLETRIGTLTESPAVTVDLCKRVPGLGVALDPSHYIAGPHSAKCFDQVLPYVRHVRLRDTGRGPEQFQVRVGQGQVEYGRMVSQLNRCRYDLALSVDIRDIPDAAFAMEPEVRKLKFLLESLV